MIAGMDDVFSALADPTRRGLLDELFKRGRADAQRARGRLPMTRFGVMKHLRVLEEAGLVVDEAPRAREAALPEPGPDPARPRPVGEQVRRAVGRRAHRAQAATGGDAMEKVFEIYIKTTPERLWEAITDPEMRRSTTSASASSPSGRRARATVGATPAADADRRGREPRGRSAAPARAELHGAVERRRQGRGHLAGDVGDRAGRRLVPADRDPRPAARRRATTSSTAAGR